MSNKVDVIIPAYNAHKTIGQTIASIVMQTMIKDIRITIVNDCSDEDYSKFVEQYKNTINIQEVKLEENAGPGVARQKGIENTDGEFITFMDADDVLFSTYAIKNLYDAINKENYDAVNSIFLEEGKEMQLLDHKCDTVWVFGKMYRRSFIEENKLHFNESRANEDTGFNKVVFGIGKCGYLSNPTYIWKYNPNSITKVDKFIYSFTGLEGFIYNMTWAVQEFYRLHLEDEKLFDVIATNMIIMYFYYISTLNAKDRRYDVNTYLQWVKKYYDEIYVKEEENITEDIIKNAWTNVARGQGNIIIENMPNITFKEFLELLKNYK